MVHIKKVDIYGFKSFGFKKTTVEFQPGLVGIAGPNGSGKSSILAAIIFAMGENRPTTMKVGSLRDLVHGSDGQGRTERTAAVSVHFDNTDRGIPIDSDTVEITRRINDAGENEYELNRKKSRHGDIRNLLEIANSGPHQLNVVLQGTVDKIAELPADEKRKKIESLIGLSAFDEKKAESEKNLEKANQKLEIAMASMGEVKKQIDDLDEERNLKLRHDMLESEIGRFEVISASNRLRSVTEKMSEAQGQLDESRSHMDGLRGAREKIRSEIRSLEEEQSKVMREMNAYTQAKSEIENELSAALQACEQTESEIRMSRRNIEQIGERIPQIRAEIRDIRGRAGAAESEARRMRDELEESGSEKRQIDSQVRAMGAERDVILEQEESVLRAKSEHDEAIRELDEALGASKIRSSRLAAELEETDGRIEADSSRLAEYGQESSKLAEQRARLERIVQNHRAAVSEMVSRISDLDAAREKTESEIAEAEQILEKAGRAATQHEAKIRMVKGIMHEDYTTAKLKENADKLGILGLVYELLSWDRRYERAVLSAGSDWIKATVVRDFATLVGLAEFVRFKRLPKLRIIPLEAIPEIRLDLPEHDGVLGALSDRIECSPEYAGLKRFLFGNIVLTSSKESAYSVSKAGYRAVTLDGEFFESQASAVTIDVNSRISKLTKIISMSTSVDGLLTSIKMLKRHVRGRRGALKRTDERIRSCRERMRISESGLAKAGQMLEDLAGNMERKSRTYGLVEDRLPGLREKSRRLRDEIASEESDSASLAERIASTRRNHSDDRLQSIRSELNRLDSQKSSLEARQAEILSEYNERTLRMSELEARRSGDESRVQGMESEEAKLGSERTQLESRIVALESEAEEKRKGMVGVRDREQELIATYGTSGPKMEQYEERLRELRGAERAQTREINQLERRTDLLSRDLEDLGEEQAGIRRKLDSHGFSSSMGDFDVEPILQALRAEIGSLPALNSRAPEAYAEKSDGYRMRSVRRNELERDYNRIRRFIEEIERGKRQKFLDAFDRVDKEIRHIFSEKIGGNAWLELQNEDDIFNSGISYMIQFPNSSKRESMSGSGGEKTLAGAVFVMALQKLHPSPFYLFDELDGQLDAPNAEKLSKILEERAHESQFIMISHKESVVEKAGLIYGIYKKSGVSHVLKYKDRRLPSMTQ